ncbi:DNA-binding IscR family transcriptional regulator [Pedobacter sp. UYP30]|uniref:Rrf2 family transcriptional regulator n=1 Tax=Pedobacter sp. UYP30 TaxID=1756400 RepID=UPI003390B07E
MVECALRAMLYIAQNTLNGEKVDLREIAEAIDSPKVQLSKTLKVLIKKNLLQCSKDNYHEYYLDERSLKTSLADVVKAIDHNLFSLIGDFKLLPLSQEHIFSLDNQWQNIRNEMLKMLEDAKLDSMGHQLNKEMFYLRS